MFSHATITGESPGFINSLRNFASTSIHTFRTRAEIIVTELEEERERLEEMILLALVGIFCVSLGILLLTLFVIVIFWDSFRLPVLGGFAALYLIAGVVSLCVMRAKIKAKPKLFSTTFDELSKDEQQLKP